MTQEKQIADERASFPSKLLVIETVHYMYQEVVVLYILNLR